MTQNGKQLVEGVAELAKLAAKMLALVVEELAEPTPALVIPGTAEVLEASETNSRRASREVLLEKLLRQSLDAWRERDVCGYDRVLRDQYAKEAGISLWKTLP